MLHTVFPAKTEEIGSGLSFIKDVLTKRHFSKKAINDALLLSEESMAKLIDKAPSDAKMKISVKNRIGLTDFTISVRGTERAAVFSEYKLSDIDENALDHSNEAAIRNILLASYGENIKSGRKGNYNIVKITAGNKQRTLALYAFFAMFSSAIIGILLGIILKSSIQNFLNQYFFIPILTAFFNSLKLLVAPTVFFSIITSVARYSSMSHTGRINIKTIVGYALTSLIAIFVSYGIFKLIEPGVSGQLSVFSLGASELNINGNTVLNTVVNIIPDNIISPFLQMNTPQIIFLAAIFGIALGKTESYSNSLSKASVSLEALCIKVTELLSSVVPYVVFISTLYLVTNVGAKVLLSVAEMFAALFIALLSMIIIYGLILLFTGVNPFIFIKKYSKTMWNTLLQGSGVSALPRTIRCCKNTLGISPKVYSFSIPFGAMANMDGNCVYFVIAGLFLAKLCGVEVLSNDIIPLIFTVFMLSIGAPITSGSVLLCLTVLLGQLNISLGALSVLLGVNVIVEMLLAMSDTFGDVAMTLAIAKTENLLNTDIFYSKRTKTK